MAPEGLLTEGVWGAAAAVAGRVLLLETGGWTGRGCSCGVAVEVCAWGRVVTVLVLTATTGGGGEAGHPWGQERVPVISSL